MKLQSMTDYVLEQKRPIPSADLHEADYYYQEYNVLQNICNYSNFLKQPLTLGMFIPTDENGNVLEQPLAGMSGYDHIYKMYSEAKDRVIFEGFDFNNENNLYQKILNDFYIGIYFSNQYIALFFNDTEIGEINTIEDLVKYNLTITKTAVKKYGL